MSGGIRQLLTAAADTFHIVPFDVADTLCFDMQQASGLGRYGIETKRFVLYIIYGLRRPHLIAATTINRAIRSGHYYIVESVKSARFVVGLTGGTGYQHIVFVPLPCHESQIFLAIGFAVLVAIIDKDHIVPFAVYVARYIQREMDVQFRSLALALAYRSGIETNGKAVDAYLGCRNGDSHLGAIGQLASHQRHKTNGQGRVVEGDVVMVGIAIQHMVLQQQHRIGG